MPQITRQDYLDRRVSHEEYYRSIAAMAGIKYSQSNPLIAEVRRALSSGDKHLNSIPLARWDRQTSDIIPYTLAAAFKAHGDYATAAGLVCLFKTVATDAANKEILF